MISLSTSRGSHQQHTGWLAWALRSVKLEDAYDLFQYNALRAVTIELHDLSLACLFHTLDLKSVLGQRIYRELIDVFLLELDNFILALKISLNLVN